MTSSLEALRYLYESRAGKDFSPPRHENSGSGGRGGTQECLAWKERGADTALTR